ncbi:CsiV family protein [Marinobacter sp. F3R08]|uniref:CsiV family protein n=1 Tax=Marinobacter sp. F3R08 TaxID=2841559 RepID=UPI001C091586|nr:CsiV family protein [Marinobacter sp. F3R08]MBU2955305.1 peptidoglycan binding protein CsiV [Marinobacter sp. F3R08]
MQINGTRWCRYPIRAILAAALLGFSATGAAQQADQTASSPGSGSSVPNDYYRAEFVILERIVEPGAVNEHMSVKAVEEPTVTDEILWSELENGTTKSTLKLVPRNRLHLANAAARLERSGGYRVLATAGWYETFPQDYKGTPLRVETGNWINDAGTREVEGHITIDRKRYLHVNVHLNHWQLADGTAAMPAASTETDNAEKGASATQERDSASTTEAPATTDGAVSQPLTLSPAPAPLELVTWIRETRRMRSEEIHFLDSPTIGVLVFFRKVEARE